MAAPTVVGTPLQIDASAGNGNTGATVDVPAGTNLVVAFWAHWDGDAGSTLSGLTLDGASFFPADSQLAEGAVAGEVGVGVAHLVSPTVADNLTVAWTWSAGGARSEGGEIVLVYVQDANTGDPVRDSGTNATLDTTDCAVTIDSETTDLVLAFCQSFQPGPPADPVLDTTGSSESTLINNGVVNSEVYDVMSAVGAATSTTASITNEYYSSIAAISIKEDAGGGGAAPVFVYSLATTGVGY